MSDFSQNNWEKNRISGTRKQKLTKQNRCGQELDEIGFYYIDLV